MPTVGFLSRHLEDRPAITRDSAPILCRAVKVAPRIEDQAGSRLSPVGGALEAVESRERPVANLSRRWFEPEDGAVERIAEIRGAVEVPILVQD